MFKEPGIYSFWKERHQAHICVHNLLYNKSSGQKQSQLPTMVFLLFSPNFKPPFPYTGGSSGLVTCWIGKKRINPPIFLFIFFHLFLPPPPSVFLSPPSFLPFPCHPASPLPFHPNDTSLSVTQSSVSAATVIRVNFRSFHRKNQTFRWFRGEREEVSGLGREF